MSTPLGSFSFEVGASVAPAQRALQQLVQQAQQAAQQVKQAFDGTRIAPGRLRIDVSEAQKAEAAVNRVAQVVKQATDRSTIVVRAEVSEAQEGLDRLEARARAIANTRVNLTARLANVREAEEALGRMAAALQRARAGETINLNVRAESVERADAAVRRLEADINRARAAGARVNVNVQTNEQGGGIAREVGRGFLQQATPGLATGAAAAAGVVLAQATLGVVRALRDAAAAGIRYNAMLEVSAAQMEVFTGSAEESEEALRRLRRFADVTPFNTEEVVRSGAVFARVTGGNIALMERYVRLAGQLGATNPEEGISGATRAITEALAGDFTSAQTRFNIPRSAIQSIRDARLSGEQLAEALVKAAGGSQQLLDKMGGTLEGRLSTFRANLDNIAAVASKPIFDALSSQVARFNAAIEKNLPTIERYARALGQVISANPIDLFTPSGVGSIVTRAVNAGQTAPPVQQPVLSDQGQASQQIRARIAQEIEAHNRKLSEQRKLVEDLKKEQENLEQTVKKITLEYEKQLRPLEAQRNALADQQRGLEARQRATAEQREAALPPVAVRAEAAAAQVLLDHEQELLEIRHRRAELAEQVAKAEEAAAIRAGEAQIRASERALEALQRRVQAENEARQIALENLREEIRARQEARQVALEALRDIIQARQEERREALDAIREEIQARQEARREALDALREQIDERRRLYDEAREDRDDARRAAQEAFQDQERLAERAHTAAQDRYRDQIEALREQAASVEERIRRESDAQKELAAFDRAERARQRAFSIASAERNVLQARTGRERADALQRLAEIRAQATADARREELQARIERERQEGDRRREAIQQKIADLERKARQEDREYQRERDARREAFEAQQRQQAAADRAEEREERARRRAEDAAIRAAEKADREATKREQAEIRALEKADREQTKAENAAIRAAERADRDQTRRENEQIRAQERADREADRAAQREIIALQQQIVNARNALADRKDAFEAVLDAAGLARLREQVDLENRQLDIRQRLATATDAVKLAQAAAEEVFTQQAAAVLQRQIEALDAQITAIKQRQETEISGLRLVLDDLDIRIAAAKRALEELEKGPSIDPRIADEGPHEGGRGPFQAAAAGAAAGKGFGEQFVAKVQEAFATLVKLFTDPNTEGSPVWAAIESAKLAIAGWNAILTDDQTAEKVAEEWGARSRDKIIKDVWDAQSPSRVTIQLGKDVAQGFIDGLTAEERRIVDALEAPWIEVDQRFWPEVERKWKGAGADHAKAYEDGFKAHNLDQKIEREIDAILRRVEQQERLFNRAGRSAAVEFVEGFCHNLTGLIDCFKRNMEWMVDNARAYGTRVGANFSTGFGQTASVGGAPGGGGGDPGGFQEWHEAQGGICRIWRLYSGGWAVYGRHAAHAGMQSGPPPGAPGTTGGGGRQPIQTRALGGPVWPGQAFLVGERGPEMFIPRGAGSVIPPALTMSTLAGGGLAQISSRGAVSIQINQTVNALPGMDANAVASLATDQAVAAIIDIFDDAERRAPNPLSRILPGGVR